MVYYYLSGEILQKNNKKEQSEMKKWLTGLLAITICLGMCACGKDTEKNPDNSSSNRSEGLAGNVNVSTGREVPIASIENNLFQNGLLAVKKGARWGFIDETGEFVIRAQFAEVENFGANGLAAVKKTSDWGYIDQNGEYVIEEHFKEAFSFSESGLAYVRTSINECGFIDESGEFVYEIESIYNSWHPSIGQYEPVRVGDEGWSFVDKTGNLISEDRFVEVRKGFASNGLAAVKTEDGWGFIDTSGEFVIQPQFDNVLDFQENGVALVHTENGWGYIDSNGAYYLEPQFRSAFPFSDNGLARIVSNENGKYGFINTKGQIVIEPQYSYADDFGENGLAPVATDEGYGYINAAGEFVIEPQYGYATEFYDDGYACVRHNKENEDKNNVYSIIDAEGNYIITDISDVLWPIY